MHIERTTLQTIGGRKIKTVTKTAAYEVAVTDELIVCNKTSAFTVTLPSATGSGRKLTIQNINTGIVTVDGYSDDTISGEANIQLEQWSSMQVVDYASTKWVIV